MTKKEAIELIKSGKPGGTEPTTWADLGCGEGLFSRALAWLLPFGSKIICIDHKQQYYDSHAINDVTLEFVRADFTRFDLGNQQLDGFLMANSLHYVQNQESILQHLGNHLKSNGKLIVIEYETSQSNPWVPYPITYAELSDLCRKLGFGSTRKLGERHSIYGQSMMYACEINKKKP